MKKTGKLALGGIFTGLALVFLALTVMPVTTLGLAALAALCGIPLTVELGHKAGLLHFAAVGLLSLLLIPAMEGKLVYLLFFGWYTVFKAWLEQKSLARSWEYLIKIGVFLAALGGGGWLGYTLLTPSLPEWWAWWMIPAGAVLLTAVFLVYDRCLTGLVGMYLTRFQKTLRRLFRL